MNLDVIMYHYVRDLHLSRFPNLKALNLSEFKFQLTYFNNRFQIIQPSELNRLLFELKDLPSLPSIVLTFDDGYLEHYTSVFPLLVNNGFSGFFFPPVSAVAERKLLDVNKIHLILENSKNINSILDSIFEFIKSKTSSYNLLPYDVYYKDLAIANRFDTKEIIFIKRILQHALPDLLRQELTEKLFYDYVKVEEKIIADELYLTVDQLKVMCKYGMRIGGHGNQHLWLNKCDYLTQKNEIEKSKEFLLKIGVNEEDLTFCYPYGGYNQDTLTILKELGFKIGFTTKVGKVNLTDNSALELPRFDTNDFPKKELMYT